MEYFCSIMMKRLNKKSGTKKNYKTSEMKRISLIKKSLREVLILKTET